LLLEAKIRKEMQTSIMLFARIIINILAIALPSLRISPLLLISIATIVSLYAAALLISIATIVSLYAAALLINVVYI
jgi:hypothetical protein